jgi:hypothetical protein
MSNQYMYKLAEQRIAEQLSEVENHPAKSIGYLNKMASDRLGVDRFGLAEAVYGMAKKAYLHRNEWKIISAGIDELKNRGL